ncbi:MAG: AAA family ATPase [Nannocystaceae bacterium]
MWLDELRLTDFRGFEHLTLDLRRPLTVIIGTNGAGKSSVVDALEIAASHATNAALGHVNALPLRPYDVRRGRDSCSIGLSFGDVELGLRRTVERETERTPQQLAEEQLPPLVILFKTDRARLGPPPPPRSLGVTNWARASVRSPNPAWDDGFGGSFTSFEHAEQWFRDREDLENQERVRSKRLDHVDPGLSAVRRAIEAIVPGYSDPHIDRSLPPGSGISQLVLTKDDRELTADMLSDGERSLLVLAMTIARRLSLLGDEAGSQEHSAVVVIDEVELHLHPRWQRQVLPALLRTFPSCQFIVTTHSPQVIGSVPRSSLVVLEDFRIHSAAAPTAGRDSNAILEEIMDATERSEPFAQRLTHIAELLDGDDLEAARTAIDGLAAEWGDDDREVVGLRTALEFRRL